MYKKKLTKSFFDTNESNSKSRNRFFQHNKENVPKESSAISDKSIQVSEVTKSRLKSFNLQDDARVAEPKGPVPQATNKPAFTLSQPIEEPQQSSSQAEERVRWKVSPPPSNRQHGSAQKLTINEMFDIYQASQHSSQTPIKQLDPTGNLWSRYDSAEPLPYLDLDLSPAAQKTPRTDAALRRTTSLPTWSTDCRERKRRKLLGPREDCNADGHVRTMMERVQEALLQSRESPIPNDKQNMNRATGSNLQKRTTTNILSDDFDDDDIDDDFLAGLPELRTPGCRAVSDPLKKHIVQDLKPKEIADANIVSVSVAQAMCVPSPAAHDTGLLGRDILYAPSNTKPPPGSTMVSAENKQVPGSPGQSSNYSIDFDDLATVLQDAQDAVNTPVRRHETDNTVFDQADQADPGKKPSIKALTQEELLEGLDDEMFSDFDEPIAHEDKAIYQVVEISQTVTQGNPDSNISLSLKLKDKSGYHKYAKLSGDWADSTITEGDMLRLHGLWQDKNTFLASNLQGLVILHPDVLVSCTSVADASTCMRKSVLQDRVRATSQLSKALLYGSVLHAILQIALVASDFSDQHLRQAMDAQIQDNLEKLFLLDETVETAKDYLYSKIVLLQQWAETFHGEDKLGAVEPMRGKDKIRAVAVGVSRALDIEERFWSPNFGLKGNVDVTAEMNVRIDDCRNIVTAPLEFKTGKTSYQQSSHRAQVILYTLIMSERYNIDVTAGFLYYLETRQITRVTALHNEVRSLVIMRNEIARHMKDKTIPPMIANKRLCGSCYAAEACFTYAKSHTLPEEKTQPDFKELFTSRTAHLGERALAFFNKWEALITQEEGQIFQYRHELWHMSSKEREKVERCFGNLQIVAGTELHDPKAGGLSQWTYELFRVEPELGFTESQVCERDPIILSDEEGRFAISCGFVTSIRADRITVKVDRPLRDSRSRLKDFDALTKQVFTGTRKQVDKLNTIKYRLDRDEFKNGMGMVRNNLISLLLDPGSKNASTSTGRHCELIVELAAPKFDVDAAARIGATQSDDLLNVDQMKAKNKIISAKDYALILGMPGTGKTTTIARIIRSLVAAGQSVLLTSYTHSAVDTILLKLVQLAQHDISVLRLGGHSKINPDVAKFAKTEKHNCKSFEELEKYYNDSSVVATTCLSINHAIFGKRRFDYCIFDEASQATLPVCIGPLRFADKFVLVGDHYQLPPLVKDVDARKQGLDISLFKMLCEAHPSAVVELQHQYRMNADIMSVSNELIYDGRLTCGTKDLESRTLEDIDLKRLETMHAPGRSKCLNKCWLEYVLEPARCVVYLNTDAIASARETRSKDHIINTAESTIIANIVEGLLVCGMRDLDIGVISPYRSQLKQIQQDICHHPGVTVDTADKFQGRDKDCIIVSLVRSNESKTIGELLKDWRRINVAFTRAKSKMIIVGSQDTLANDKLLNAFLHLVHRKGWAYDLPVNALQSHPLKIKSQTQHASVEVKTKRQVKVSTAGEKVIFHNRPILRDLMNAM